MHRSDMGNGSDPGERDGGPGEGGEEAPAIGKTAEEVHADLISEGQSVTLAEVEAVLEEWAAIGFIDAADFSVGEAVVLVQRDGDPPFRDPDRMD